MIERERPEFVKALVTMAEPFQREITDLTAEIYFDVLKGFDLETVQRAMRKAIGMQEFFPMPAVIIRLIGDAPDRSAYLPGGAIYEARIEGRSGGHQQIERAPDKIAEGVLAKLRAAADVDDPPPPTMTEEQVEARKRELRQQAEELEKREPVQTSAAAKVLDLESPDPAHVEAG